MRIQRNREYSIDLKLIRKKIVKAGCILLNQRSKKSEVILCVLIFYHRDSRSINKGSCGQKGWPNTGTGCGKLKHQPIDSFLDPIPI